MRNEPEEMNLADLIGIFLPGFCLFCIFEVFIFFYGNPAMILGSLIILIASGVLCSFLWMRVMLQEYALPFRGFSELIHPVNKKFPERAKSATDGRFNSSLTSNRIPSSSNNQDTG
jgi:hypothetical protein